MLPDPWDKPVSHSPGIFFIPIQLDLQGAVLQRGADEQVSHQQYHWHTGPQRTKSERNHQLRDQRAGITRMAVKAIWSAGLKGVAAVFLDTDDGGENLFEAMALVKRG